MSLRQQHHYRMSRLSQFLKDKLAEIDHKINEHRFHRNELIINIDKELEPEWQQLKKEFNNVMKLVQKYNDCDSDNADDDDNNSETDDNSDDGTSDSDSNDDDNHDDDNNEDDESDADDSDNSDSETINTDDTWSSDDLSVHSSDEEFIDDDSDDEVPPVKKRKI